MAQLLSLTSKSLIPEEYLNTPIGDFFEYHNLNKKHLEYSNAQMLIGMCMDNRKKLKIPENFAYVLRTGGANLKELGFKISFAIAVGGIRHIALIGHNYCGMVNLTSKKEAFIEGLMETGWKMQDANEHFNNYAPLFEISNEKEFILEESKRLQKEYPLIKVVPLFYNVDDNLIHLIKD